MGRLSMMCAVVRRVAWLSWCAAAVALAACADSHLVSGLPDGGMAPSRAPVPIATDRDGSVDGMDPSGGGGSSGSTTGEPVAGGIGCISCQPASVFGLLSFPACCTADDQCGLDFEMLAGGPLCIERDAPGTPDSTCPMTMVMGFPLPGCCRPDATCGVQVTLVPLGCISGAIASLLPGGGGGSGGPSGGGGAEPAPASPKSCTPSRF
jgi:hypothetical protein